MSNPTSLGNRDAAVNSSPEPFKGRLHVFALIDGLGWQIVKDRSFLNAELHYRKPLQTVLGYSSGAIPTILTGLRPARSGLWNLFYYDPEGSPFRWLRSVSFLPERVLDNRVSRKVIKELGRHVLGMGPLFECFVSPRLMPWFNYLEKKNIYGEGGLGTAESIFDLLIKRGIPYRVYSYHQYSDAEALRRARQDVKHDDANFFFLYLSEMDHFLHDHRNDHDAISERLSWYERELREVFGAAVRRDPEMTFTVISDHGMTPVRFHYDLVGKIETLGWRMPKHYLSVYDSTMARYWFFDEAARQSIVAELEGTRCGRIVEDSELERLGILFPDRRYGQVVFLLDPGWLFSRSDFNGRAWNPAGMHGYHPSDANSDAIFLSNRHPRHQMTSIDDVYLCMQEAARPIADERGAAS